MPINTLLRVDQMIMAACAQHSDSPAIITETESISYGVLANRIAYYLDALTQQGVSAGSYIGVWLPSSPDLIAAIVAIFRLGALYVPIDNNFSPGRLQQVLSEANSGYLILNPEARALLTERSLPGHLIDMCIWELRSAELHLMHYAGGQWRDGKLDTPANAVRLSTQQPDAAYVVYTSGTTGEAKGILGSHTALSQFIRWEITLLSVGKGDRITQIAPITFDASFKDIFTALCAGATLVIPTADTKANFNLLSELILVQEITILQTVPSIFRNLLNAWEDNGVIETEFNQLRYIMLAGEMLYQQDITRWRNLAGDATEIINLYGTTETTILKAFYRIPTYLPSDLKSIPVGQGINDAELLVVKQDKRCDVGELGEVYVRSPNLSLGYLRNEQNIDRFVVDPLAPEATEKVYRTGDLGKVLPDGNVELVGRLDDQVKIHGIRVELGGIHHVLTQLAQIKEAVVTTLKGVDGEVELIAYYTGRHYPQHELLALLGKHLNQNILPAYLVHMDKFPLTKNGKIDKKALPGPTQFTDVSTSISVVGKGELTEKLLIIWQEVFKRNDITVDHSFFELGGSSLKAIQLISKAFKNLGITLSIKDIFEKKTIKAIANGLRNNSQDGANWTIPQAPSAKYYPLTRAQNQLWVAQLVNPAQTSYNMVRTFRISGLVNVPALQAACQKLIALHESLRTHIVVIEDVPLMQVVGMEEYQMGMRIVRVNEEDLSTRLKQEANQSFQLEGGQLFEVVLLSTSTINHVFLIRMHHILSDGWSMDLIINQLMAAYTTCAGLGQVPLPTLDIQYKDYAVWMQQQYDVAAVEKDRAYWLSQFAGEIPVLNLPTDYVRGVTGGPRHGDYCVIALPLALVQQLRHEISKQQSSLFVFLLANLYTLLHRLTGAQDIVVGAPEAGRNNDQLTVQVGMFVNNLALRHHVSAQMRFTELLQGVQDTVLGAFEHNRFPFDILLDEVNPPRLPGRSPLFDVGLVVQNTRAKQVFELGNIRVEPLEIANLEVTLDLKFVFNDLDGELFFNIDYDKKLYTAENIKLMLQTFVQLLEQVVENPEQTLDELQVGTTSKVNNAVNTSFNF
jgi:amino acid adenylation domain-containing protein